MTIPECVTGVLDLTLLRDWEDTDLMSQAAEVCRCPVSAVA